MSPALSPWWMLQSCPLGCPQTLLPPAPALDSGTSRRADLDVLFWSSPTKADWRMLLVGGHQSHPAQPLWEAVAVHGVGSLRTGGEGAPACRVGGMGEAGRRGCAWGGRLGQTSAWHPRHSSLQTFFFNVFESPAELFDAPIFITVSFGKRQPSGGPGRCWGPSPCPPPHSPSGNVACFPGEHPAGSSTLFIPQVVDSRSFRMDAVIGEFRVRLPSLRSPPCSPPP